jgi:hypothetical protein
MAAACSLAPATHIKDVVLVGGLIMARHLRSFIAAAVALAAAASLVTDAQALERRAHRHVAARHGGDIVVHTGRSYLDPGTSAEVGSENHYFSDSLGPSYGQLGIPFSSATAGNQLLPTRLNPPGRAQPLFEF